MTNICRYCKEGRHSEALVQASINSNVREFKDESFTLWKCHDCQSICLLEDVDLDKYYESYPIADKKLDFFSRNAFLNLLRYLKKLGLTKKGSFLDYGCSEGILVSFMKDRGYNDSYGYDPYSGVYNDERVLEKKYTCITAIDVIEHVEDPEKLFAMLSDRLKPNGLLCIGTPRAEGLTLLNHRSERHELHAPYHLCILSEAALLELGIKYGLTAKIKIRKSLYDTWWPFSNVRFLNSYLNAIDGTLDAGFDSPKLLAALRPSLFFNGLFGGLMTEQKEMVIFFQKT